MHVSVTWEPSSRQVWLGDIRPDVIGMESIRSTDEELLKTSYTLVYITKHKKYLSHEITHLNM